MNIKKLVAACICCNTVESLVFSMPNSTTTLVSSSDDPIEIPFDPEKDTTSSTDGELEWTEDSNLPDGTNAGNPPPAGFPSGQGGKVGPVTSGPTTR